MKEIQAKCVFYISPVLPSRPAETPPLGPYRAMNYIKKLNLIDPEISGRSVSLLLMCFPCWCRFPGMWN